MQRLAVLTVLILCLSGRPVSGAMLTVEADEMVRIGSRIEARGNVVMTGETLSLKADYVVYDTEGEDIWATGDCVLKEEKGEVNASSIIYNARRKDLHIQEGSVLGYDPPMRITGESITRYGEDYYTGNRVEYTPCLGTPPDWSVRTEDMVIPVEGYGEAHGVRFEVRSWPILRFPYLLFPAMLTRHSGVLFPEFGHGSDYGYRFGLPLYYVPGRSTDITITPTWLTDRGLLVKNEFRYSLDYERTGLVYGEFLRDELGGEPSDGGVLEEIPDDRWFFKARQGGPGLNWDINLVSTVDYFRDIGTFYESNLFTGEMATGEINRLDDSAMESLISRMQWTESLLGLTFSASGQFTQDLTVENNGSTIQEMPRLTARLRDRDIPLTPLRTTAEISSVRVSTQDWIEARKDNGQVEVSLPLSFFPYFTLRPYVSEYYRDTIFSDTQDAYPDSTYAEFWEERGASVSTTLYSSRIAGGMYHQVVPEVTYSYHARRSGDIDTSDPEDVFPQILDGDDWQKSYEARMSLANFIRDGNGASLAELTISSIYCYLDDRMGDTEFRALVQPATWLSASHRNTAGRDPKRPFSTREHSTTLSLSDSRGDTMAMGLEYDRQETELLTAALHAELLKGLSAGYETEYNNIERSFDKASINIGYISQCWSMLGKATSEAARDDRPRKTTWSLTVRLLGMGDLKGLQENR